MKNRIISIVLILCMTLAFVGCSTSESTGELNFIEKLTHEHDFAAATCTEPQTCYCGETQGESLGHYFAPATCTKPETCARCDATQGEPNGHDFDEATCTESAKCKKCSETEGSPLGHDYVKNVCTRCEDVDPESLPVGLNELPVIDYEYGYEYYSDVLKDNFGNTYIGYHRLKEAANESYVVFNLDNKYSKFVCDIVVNSERESKLDAMVQMYVDNKLVFQKDGISKTTGLVHVDFSVKSGQQLKIVAVDSNYSYSEVACLVNAQLYKK